MKILRKFHFQYSHLKDSEYKQICKNLFENEHCFATHLNDVGKLSIPFRIRLKLDAELQTQTLNKVFIFNREKLNTLLHDLQEKGVRKQFGSTPHEKPIYGTTFLNPFTIIKKNDSIKNVLDARHLNSNTDQSSESWPMEPLATPPAKSF